MCIEDVSVTATELFLRAILDGFELSSRKPDSRPKPPALPFEIGLRDMCAISFVCAFLQAQHATNHDSIGNTQPLAAQLVDRPRNSGYIDFLRLVKVALEETENRIQRFLFINAVSNNF